MKWSRRVECSEHPCTPIRPPLPSGVWSVRFTGHGRWEVKPRHWLIDLVARDAPAADYLNVALNAPAPGERRAALEALALCLLDSLEYGESATEPQVIP